MKKVRLALILSITLCLVVSMASCSKEKEMTDSSSGTNILGRWIKTTGDQEMVFFEDGTYSVGFNGNYQNGTYSISPTVLRLIDSTGTTEIYDCVLEGDTLTLALGDTKTTYSRKGGESISPTRSPSPTFDSESSEFGAHGSENTTSTVTEDQLLGKWISEDQIKTWEFTGNGECNYADGLATGYEYYSFLLEDNMIILRPIQGDTMRLICSIENAVLTLTTETGETNFFYKVEESSEEQIVGAWLADVDGQLLTFSSAGQLNIYSKEMLNAPQYKLTYAIDSTAVSIYTPTGMTYSAEYTLKANQLTLTTTNWGTKTYSRVSEVPEPSISPDYTVQNSTSDEDMILGHWVCIDRGYTHEMFFFENGTCSSGSNGNLYSFSWSLSDGFLQMSSPTGVSEVLQYELTNNSLTIFDNSQTMVFQKQDN